jgi:predicted nucleic acid-binding protein
MMLIDTSAWVEFLRQTGSAANLRVVEALRADQVVTTDPVVMEVVSGARNDGHERQLEALLGRAVSVRCTTEDFVAAARLYRACRHGGETVRQVMDCLVASISIRSGFPVLHADRDFEAIARHSALELA